MGRVSPADVERRYARVRDALARDGLDAALVCGTEYTGFEGQVTYLSGFQIVHRYAYSPGVGTGHGIGDTVSVPRVSQSAFLIRARMISEMPIVAMAR